MEKEGKTLVKRHAFGARCDVKGSLGWLDEGTLMYPVGKAVALHTIATNNQRFLEASYQSTGVTAIAASANKKFIAVAEGGDNPQIQIIDTTTRKRRKVLTVPDLGSDRFTAMAFSADGRHLVTQGGAPNWNLFYWNWERSKPLASVSIAAVTEGELARDVGMNHNNGNNNQNSPSGASNTNFSQSTSVGGSGGANSPHGALVTSVAVCPGDALTVTISGVGLLRFYKYTDGFLQPQPSCGYPREQQEVFLTHAWLDAERLVASTKLNGDLLLVDRGRYMGQLSVPHQLGNIRTYDSDNAGNTEGDTTQQKKYTSKGAGALAGQSRNNKGNGEGASVAAVTSIVPTKSGFVTGSSNGAVCVYQGNPNPPSTDAFRYAGTARPGGAGDEEEGDSLANSLYEPVCCLSVPEREPGEPVDLSPHRDPNSAGAQGASAGANAAARHAGAESGAGGLGGSVGVASSSVTAMTTRSGKPRRFRATPPIGAVAGTATASVLSAGDGSGFATAGAGGAGGYDSPNKGTGAARDASSGARGAVASASSAMAAQEAAGALLGTAVHKHGHGVASMALDQGEETLAVLTNAGKIYALDFRQHWAQVQREIDNQLARGGTSTVLMDSAVNKSTRSLMLSGGVGTDGLERSTIGGSNTHVNPAAAGLTNVPTFEPVCEPFHSGRINGMACSVRKPFLITTSSDHSVRLWNTSTHRMEMCVFFKEEPGAVALHPSGLMAVICFPDCVRVMSVLWSTLRDRRVINFRHASDVAFSHGGQFFAVTHGNLVDIFHSTTCEPHGQLRGHPQKVKDLKWCSTSPYPTDNSLITCSMDGMIMYWSSQDARKEAEHSDNKRYQYLAVAADDRYVWALGAPTTAAALEVQWKVTLRELDRHVLGSPNASSEDYEFTDTALTSLVVAPHQRMLFGGGEDGSLKVMTLPLPVGVQEAPLPAHGGRITRMAVSHDEATLFTAGADGSIFIWDIREGGSRAVAAGAGAGTQMALGATSLGGAGGAADSFQYGTNEVLVTQQELEEQRVEVESLQHTIEKLKTDIDSEEKRRNHEQGTRMRERMEEFKGDAATLAGEYAAVWNSKAEQERAFVAIKLEKEAEVARAIEQTETTHQAEVQALEEMCNDLQYTLEKEQSQHAQDLQALEERIAEEEAQEQDRYKDLVAQRKEVLEKLSRQVTRAKQTNQETLHQLELDTDAESQEVGNKHQRELNTLRERFLHMKGDGAIMRKNAVRMEREIDVRAGELRLLDSAKAALVTQLSELSVRMAQLHQDIDERDAVIGEKEKSIYSLKKHNQELEKFKFVLDHRIRQLKAQMEPKQREIIQHNQQIKIRNGELESLHASNLTLRSSIESLKTDLSDQQQHIKQLLHAIKDFETYKTAYLRDVGDIAPALQEPAMLRDVIAKLYTTHVVNRGGERVAAADPQIRQEFKEQLEYLSTSVGALRRKVKADQERHRAEASAMMTENLALIKEIHALRTEIHELRTVVATEEAVRRARGSLAATAPARGSRGGRGGRGRRQFSASQSGGGGGAVESNVEEGRVQDVFNATADGVAATAARPAGALGSTNAAAMSSPTTSGVAKVNLMPSASAPHSHLPPARQSSRGSVQSQARRTPSRGPTPQENSRAPEPPKAIEENRTELRMLRAYIEVLEKALADSQRPSSAGSAGRLPPISLDGADANATV